MQVFSSLLRIPTDSFRPPDVNRPDLSMQWVISCRDAASDGNEIRPDPLHTAEVERVDQTARGLAVHLASRVISHAPAGGIVVTRTVRDLVLGSRIAFADMGNHELRGVPDTWDLFAATEVP